METGTAIAVFRCRSVLELAVEIGSLWRLFYKNLPLTLDTVLNIVSRYFKGIEVVHLPCVSGTCL